MSISVGVAEAGRVWEPPVPAELNEATWRAWVARGRAQDKRDSAAIAGAARWLSIVALVAMVGLWPNLAPYGVVVKFLVCGGAIVLMFHEFGAGHRTLAAVFGALALLYNPVAPMFGIPAGWQRTFVLASAVLFVASLAGSHVRRAQ